MKADGTQQVRRTFDDLTDFAPAWSPNGKRLLFSSYRDFDPETGEVKLKLYSARASDGGDVVDLTGDAGNDAYWGDWR